MHTGMGPVPNSFETYHLVPTLFRRLFQMGVHNAEIFTNMGMCCFYAQHYDMALGCFQRALTVASDDTQADIWYNIGHVALVRA